MAVFDSSLYNPFYDQDIADNPDDPTVPDTPDEPVPPVPGPIGGIDNGTAQTYPDPATGGGYVPPPYGGPTRPTVGAVPLFDAPEFEGVDYEALRNDPAYLFRLEQGLGAAQASAAARGILRTGGVVKGLQDYAQDYASQEIENANTRAERRYGLAYQAARDEYAPLLAEWGANNEANSAEFNRLWDMYVNNLNDQWRHDEAVLGAGSSTGG